MICRRFLCLGLLLAIAACGQRSDPDLTQAIGALRSMSSSSGLSRSCFSVVYPDGKPSEFITYMFSDLGAAEMPMPMDEGEAEQMKSAGQAMLPRTVLLSPAQRIDPNNKELVLIANDAEQSIVLKGYLNNQTEPLTEVTIPLGKGTPPEEVRMLCNSAIGAGASPF